MKKIFVIILTLFVGFAYAENENVPTSKKFVDDALAQKQPKFDGLGNDKLMLYSNTTDGVVASRDIVTTLGNSTSADSVPTVGAINAGLATKQDTLNGDAGWVAENTGIAGAVVQKPVYSATNNYGNALVEVETLNNAVINAVNSELTVVPGVGWTINTASNLNLLSTARTYIGDVAVPDGYTQLGYIESTGKQYIDTGFTVDGSKSLQTEVQLQLTTNSAAEQAIIGFRSGGGYELFFIRGERVCTWVTKGQQSCIPINYVPGVTYTIKSEKGTNFIKTNVDDHQALYEGTVDKSYSVLYLFGLVTGYGISAKAYYIRIWQDNTLIRNFIPARRNSDSVVGMYDTVSGTFFTNAGTGTFTAGPDVNSN